MGMPFRFIQCGHNALQDIVGAITDDMTDEIDCAKEAAEEYDDPDRVIEINIAMIAALEAYALAEDVAYKICVKQVAELFHDPEIVEEIIRKELRKRSN